MFRHVVMFRWSDEATDEAKDAALAAVGRLPDQIDAIRSYSIGTDAGVNEGNYDACVVADFDDVEGYLTYRDHPAHVAAVKDLLAPNAAARAAVQYET